MNAHHPHIVAALACALFLTPCIPAQEDPPKPSPVVDQQQAKLDEWPALKSTEKDRVLALAGQFRKADPELHTNATKELIAIGAGGAPLLFQQVADRAENQNAQLFVVFDATLTKQHGALMAREVKKPRAALRRYLMQRMCAFADPDLLPVLLATTKDKDELTAFYAQLGALVLQHREAVAPVLAYTKTHWKDVGDFTAKVLPAGRTDDAGSWVWETITNAAAADQMAGLRLLRYLATKDQKHLLRRYLEAPDHTVKKEAINTARVLHGEEPLENLPVFQAIELSKQWLEKL